MQSASDTTSADVPAPPPVRVVIPTRDPGPWFADAVEAISRQDYPSLAVTVLHGPGERELLERFVEPLRGPTFVELPADAGFGTKVNHAAKHSEEDLLLLLHDDVAMEPGAVSALVREFLRRRDDRTLVAAKLLEWRDPKRLMPAGFDADRFGQTSSLVKPGDYDQGQQDRIVDMFGTSTACLLLNRESFLRLGGFDEAMDWHGEAHDLALRTRATRGQIVIASAARARHRGDFEGRGGPNPTSRERRHQMRSVLASTPGRSLPGLILSYVALHIVEFVVAIGRLEFSDAVAIIRSWLWNLANIGSLGGRRQTLLSLDSYEPDALKLLRRRGSIRLSDSIDRRVTQREAAAEEDDEAAISAVRAAGGIVVAALLAFGARHLLTRPIPQIGEFRAVPDDFGTLTADWLSGWRFWGMGSEGFASFALPLLDVLGLATFGSAELARAALLIAPLPIGVLGMWRLFANGPGRTAPAAAAAMYAASPLPYNAISNGSFLALFLFAALPWALRNIVWLSQSSAFGPPRRRVAAVFGLGFIAALCVAVTPFALMILAIVLVGLVVGSFLSGDMRGVVTIVGGILAAAGIAVAANLPYLSGIDSWEMFASAQATSSTDVPLVDLLTLSTGPVGSPIYGWAMFAPALLGLFSGVGGRFTWAMRLWGVMLVAWAVVWADERGVLPVGLPLREVVLTPVALGFGVLGGIAAKVIEIDLSEAIARRFIPLAVAVIGFGVAMVPLLDASGSGRWEIAQTDLTTTYGALATDPNEGSHRIIWLGDAHVLGAGAIPAVNDMAWMSSLDGTPDFRALWRGPNQGATAALTDVINAGIEGRTSRLGRELARFGVRYVVVMDQQAPVPERSLGVTVSDIRAAGLNAQLDLVRTGVVNPAVSVFDNTAWAPIHTAVPPASLDPLRITDPQPALVERTAFEVFEGQTRVERDLYASWEPAERWTLESGGAVVERIDVGTVGMGFAASDSSTTDASFRYETSDRHRLIVYLQAFGWLLLLGVRRWAFGIERRANRRARASAERTG